MAMRANWREQFQVILGYTWRLENSSVRYLKAVHTMDIIETIKEQIAANRILLYMKGSPNQPQCGFSARTVEALMACGERFAYVDILANPDIRATLPKFANWPTFPQLWVDGELIGGCDIVTEMYQNGELQALIKATAAAPTAG
jgi:monothiol glutaredoxin